MCRAVIICEMNLSFEMFPVLLVLDFCVVTDHINQRKQTIYGQTLAVADTIPRLCNRHLTSINTSNLSYLTNLSSAGSYNLLQNARICMS
jgi:hypothetical protein